MFANGRQTQFYLNGRRPQFVQKWKTTSICSKMEDDLIFFYMDDLNCLENGRRLKLTTPDFRRVG